MSTWKPISTAKKKENITLWLYQDMRPTGGKYVFRGSWSKERNGWVCWEGGSAPWNVEPTHWQPYSIPKPPKHKDMRTLPPTNLRK